MVHISFHIHTVALWKIKAFQKVRREINQEINKEVNIFDCKAIEWQKHVIFHDKSKKLFFLGKLVILDKNLTKCIQLLSFIQKILHVLLIYYLDSKLYFSDNADQFLFRRSLKIRFNQ